MNKHIKVTHLKVKPFINAEAYDEYFVFHAIKESSENASVRRNPASMACSWRVICHYTAKFWPGTHRDITKGYNLGKREAMRCVSKKRRKSMNQPLSLVVQIPRRGYITNTVQPVTTTYHSFSSVPMMNEPTRSPTVGISTEIPLSHPYRSIQPSPTPIHTHHPQTYNLYSQVPSTAERNSD